MYSMVTARMSQSKKENGNAILEQLGTNASSVINRLYDYIIENRELPFTVQDQLSQAEIRRRITLVDSLPLTAGNRFSTMSDEEIRSERLENRYIRTS